MDVFQLYHSSERNTEEAGTRETPVLLSMIFNFCTVFILCDLNVMGEILKFCPDKRSGARPIL